MITSPAVVHTGRLDLIAANPLGRAQFAPVYDSPTAPVRSGLRTWRGSPFLDPAATSYYPDHDQAAATVVEMLRVQAGIDPYDKKLTDLVGELSNPQPRLPGTLGHPDVRHRGGGRERLEG